MSKLILPALLCGALLLPFSALEAKTYGGFKPGLTFKYKVRKVKSVKTVGLDDPGKKAKVPNTAPKLKKGKKIKFKILKRGQLKGKGFKLPFTYESGGVNTYTKTVTVGKVTRTTTAVVYKKSTTTPSSMVVYFTRKDTTDPANPVTQTVTYTIK